MRSNHLDVLLEELRRWGVAPDRVVTNSHPKIYFHVDGIPLLYVCSSTPSGDRVQENQLAELRRLLRGAGLTDPPRGRLFQQDLLDRPFWMLVACQLVNLTNWETAEPVHLELRRRYGDERGLAVADEGDLREILRPLGLWRRRSRSLAGLAEAWVTRPPVTSADVMRLPGCGRYAADTWAIFIERRTDVEPSDGKLNWYLEEITRAQEPCGTSPEAPPLEGEAEQEGLQAP